MADRRKPDNGDGDKDKKGPDTERPSRHPTYDGWTRKDEGDKQNDDTTNSGGPRKK